MTLQLRRKRPITRPNILRLAARTLERGSAGRAALAVLVLAALGWTSVCSAGEVEPRRIDGWKESGQATPIRTSVAQSRRPAQAATTGLKWRPVRRPKAAEAQAVENRSEVRQVAHWQEAERFDPFEEDVAEPGAQPQTEPVPRSEFDPFDDPAQDSRPQPRRSLPPQPETFQPTTPTQQPRQSLPPQPEAFQPTTPPQQAQPQPRPLDPLQAREEASLLITQQECREEFDRLKADRVTGIGLEIQVSGREGEDFPVECQLGQESYAGRQWHDSLYTWKASALCHKPLYFNDDQLERYGHDWGPFVQPVISGAHFFATLPILPYKMGLETPDECIYALGHYRPGSCAPFMIEPLGFTWRAALFETGAVLGAVFLIP